MYTPGMFRNGEDWTEWRQNRVSAPERSAPGNLAISLDGDIVAAHFDAKAGERLELHVALLSMNQVSKVDAGENAGKILRHDFVVMDVSSQRMKSTAAGYTATLHLDSVPDGRLGSAIVAWVSSGARQAPLQAVGGYLSPPP